MTRSLRSPHSDATTWACRAHARDRAANEHSIGVGAGSQEAGAWSRSAASLLLTFGLFAAFLTATLLSAGRGSEASKTNSRLCCYKLCALMASITQHWRRRPLLRSNFMAHLACGVQKRNALTCARSLAPRRLTLRRRSHTRRRRRSAPQPNDRYERAREQTG